MATNTRTRARKATALAVSAALLSVAFVTIVASEAAALYVHFGVDCNGNYTQPEDCHAFVCDGDATIEAIACKEHTEAEEAPHDG